MSATANRPLSVRDARRLLADTRGRSPDQVNAAETIIRHLMQRRPGRSPDGASAVARCVYCSGTNWALHSGDDGDEVWCCSDCHKAEGSDEQGRQFRAALREPNRVAAEEAEAVRVAAPTPRVILRSTHAALNEARVKAAKLESAATTAIAQLTTTRSTLGAAEEALATARARVADDMVEALLDPTIAAKKPRTIVAELAAVDGARSALELAAATADKIATKLLDCRDKIQRLERRLQWEARDVEVNEGLDRDTTMAVLLGDPDASLPKDDAVA